MKKYQDAVEKAIASITPWKATTRLSNLRKKYASQMPEGEQILVIPDSQIPASDPLFKDAPIAKDRSKRRG